MFYFFFNDTATTEIYTLSLHDALPIYLAGDHDVGRALDAVDQRLAAAVEVVELRLGDRIVDIDRDRKSTRLNSSHSQISYAVFCLKKKKSKKNRYINQTAYHSLPPTIF